MDLQGFAVEIAGKVGLETSFSFGEKVQAKEHMTEHRSSIFASG